MRRAQGCAPARMWARHRTHKISHHPISTEQEVKMTGWFTLEIVKQDVDLERVNYTGTIYQPRPDMRPRLVKRGN